MESSQHVARACRYIVLHKFEIDAGLVKFSFVVEFDIGTAMIFKAIVLYQEHLV